MTPRTVCIVHLRPLPKVDGTRALRGMLKMALADRSRRYRQRVSNGRLLVTVEIDDVTVPVALVAAGFLAADACDDRQAIAHAIQRVIEALAVGDA